MIMRLAHAHARMVGREYIATHRVTGDSLGAFVRSSVPVNMKELVMSSLVSLISTHFVVKGCE